MDRRNATGSHCVIFSGTDCLPARFAIFGAIRGFHHSQHVIVYYHSVMLDIFTKCDYSQGMTHISSVEQVITALGGAGKTAAILGQKSNTVGNWKLRDKIPAEHFLAVTEALKAEGKTVAPEVFGMRRAETVEGAPSAA